MVRFQPNEEKNDVIVLPFSREVSFAEFKRDFLKATNYPSVTFGTAENVVDDDKSLRKRLRQSANVILPYSTGGCMLCRMCSCSQGAWLSPHGRA
jgi:hypothetical protein